MDNIETWLDFEIDRPNLENKNNVISFRTDKTRFLSVNLHSVQYNPVLRHE